MPRPSPRQELLGAAIAYVEQRGISDLSLRELAAGIGTSARMLVHHFGGKEGLWVEMVRAVERRERQTLAAMLPDPDADVAEGVRRWWRHLSDPRLWPQQRLFFEVYGQALQGRPGTAELLEGIVEDWVAHGAALGAERGIPEARARARTRLGLAVVRGLLLDLLATGDREGVDAAMEEWIATFLPAPVAAHVETSSALPR